MNIGWITQTVKSPDRHAEAAARARQLQLTKPSGSLGRLEELACTLAALQGSDQPSLERIRIVVFAADHGVAVEGVSAFPQEVTSDMLRNFSNGGAAISVIAQELGAALEVVDVGVMGDNGPLPGILRRRIAAGSRNLRRVPAMLEVEVEQALTAGREAVERACAHGAQLFIGGDMGIANTTAAAALGCALLKKPGKALAGPGTGLDAKGVARKAEVIDAALAVHAGYLNDPLECLRRVGGLEIAALTGAAIACAQEGLPMLVDGFICATSVLTAVRLNPGVADWLLYSHRSAEPGYAELMSALNARPLLDLGLRLGEASGAAIAVPLLRMALALHNRMATFADAGVPVAEV
jgi:nicotinate-nucleotide--dimethylbenzimidazole phosphoribosyltransferase